MRVESVYEFDTRSGAVPNAPQAAEEKKNLLSVIAVFEGRLATGALRTDRRWDCELGLERARQRLEGLRGCRDDIEGPGRIIHAPGRR